MKRLSKYVDPSFLIRHREQRASEASDAESHECDEVQAAAYASAQSTEFSGGLRDTHLSQIERGAFYSRQSEDCKFEVKKPRSNSIDSFANASIQAEVQLPVAASKVQCMRDVLN